MHINSHNPDSTLVHGSLYKVFMSAHKTILKGPQYCDPFSMVGVTGLEPATSRPPAVRATNCATPRYSDETPILGFSSRGQKRCDFFVRLLFLKSE